MEPDSPRSAVHVHSPQSEAHSPQPAAEKAVAEMVATLYDESLDAFAPHDWPQRFAVFYEDYSSAQSQFGNMPVAFQQVFGNWSRALRRRGDHLSVISRRT